MPEEDLFKGFRLAHTMLRVTNLDLSLQFYCDTLGMKVLRKTDYPEGRFTNTFIGYGPETEYPTLELTHNWDREEYDGGRNFGHLAYRVDDIYEVCQRLMDGGAIISRPPRDGHMAFIRSPDGISIELLQRGDALPLAEPWASLDNTGEW